jgi:hypothetical protein
MGYVSFTHSSAGELTQIQLPCDGAFTYGYRSWTFSGNVTIRQVRDRYRRKDTGAALNQYSFTHNDKAADTIHQWTQVKDVTAQSEKIWSFNTNGGAVHLRLAERVPATGQPVKQETDLTWSQDPALNPYGWNRGQHYRRGPELPEGVENPTDSGRLRQCGADHALGLGRR